MNRTIRKTAWILSHIGLLLSIVFLLFFIICSARAQSAQSAPDPEEKDLYLVQAMNEHDFSVYTVGKALSDNTDPARENFFITVDLLLPLLCIAAGILLQFAAVRPRRKRTGVRPSQSISNRR